MEKEEFLKLLPRLIREDDQVKGAIITALSGVVATKEDIQEVIKSNKKEIQEAIRANRNEIQEAIRANKEEIQEAIRANKEEIKMVIAEFNKRFEAMDKRFEALQLQINVNYKELRSAIDNLGDRAGKGLEEMVLKLLQEQNKLKDVDITKFERKIIIDEEGVLFPKGYSTDIDVIMENGKIILAEIKFKVDNRDIYHFVQVSKLYERLYKKPDMLWVLTLEISPKTYEASRKFPIKVIFGEMR